ncbi:transglutaminase family protein [Rhodoferax sp.]|uniref:transglutaminase family protein n=1 Tax=Rhodoferax sp. TaxID=50421 RepID=UPI0025DE91AD|nr:transglutaminase family protein [Rhodoferax sp.]MCM2341212.1 transglutaminase family protein [Rhodoferax sp.]
MRLQITHETVYNYRPAVETAQHMAYLTPLDCATQTLLGHGLQVTPEPAQINTTQDVFGNSRSFFSLQVPHTQLQVLASSQVLTQPVHLPRSELSWESVREHFRYQAHAGFEAANEFVFASPMVPRHAEFTAYARPSFSAGTGLLAAAVDLMHRIYRDFTYESQSTEVSTPALEALAQRKGVCQDFAHILIACLRSMGLPARYVSGYLLTQAAPGTVKLKGSDASHAWVAVYVPDLPKGERWVDLDPTNDRAGWPSPGEDYVTLAVGRDFSDVSPIRGVIHGGASHTLRVGVTVEQVTDPRVLPSPGLSQTQSQAQGSGPIQSQNQSQNSSFNKP